MLRYIGKRMLSLIPILIGITFLSFALMHTTSADAVDIMENNTGMVLSEQAKEQARKDMGLDKPFLEQYMIWLKNLLSGDMGNSYVSGKPVLQTILSKLPATLLLTLTSILTTVFISVPLGVLSAVKKNSVFDYILRFFSFIGNSMPGFFVSLLLIYFFSVKMKLFPVMGSQEGLKSIILPTLTLSIAMSSKYTRQIRAVVLEEMNKDYVLGARARGVSEKTILFASVLKSSMMTVITLLSLSVGSLLGGTAIVETIFMWDGVGKMAADAIMMRDYPVIQAYVIWMAAIYVIVNLVSDIFYHALDPRVRLAGEET
ncbi:ABC transporter permease [Blautia liquoris]|uniref:Nickel import system permease protein NikB n=1 Tax=Blautia liquoris TaxID=2779518 RepID=A0A7M2RJ75_9FIRM|nr:nickel ABC transporter permease [Blautia liquoris]QOV20355.1 ABC transporter permease [Blautia liquoris]